MDKAPFDRVPAIVAIQLDHSDRGNGGKRPRRFKRAYGNSYEESRSAWLLLSHGKMQPDSRVCTLPLTENHFANLSSSEADSEARSMFQ